MDSCPLRVGVNGNVGVRCRVYSDSLSGSCLGCLVVVSQGCAFNGGCALGGYEKVDSLCWLYLVRCKEVRRYSPEELLPSDVARR